MKTIVLCYRKVIDANTTQVWEQMVHEDSYLEFKLQFQNFDHVQQYNTFSELVHHVAHADRINFLISPSIVGYIGQLEGRIPDVLSVLGKHFLSFDTYSFELINSDIRNISKHRFAINFYSKPMVWHDTIGNHLLLSEEKEDSVLTSLYHLQPFVNIHSIQYL